MKTIAFLYNVRHQYPDPKDYRDQLQGDFDDPITIKWQIKHLRNLGFKIFSYRSRRKSLSKTLSVKKQNRPSFQYC